MFAVETSQDDVVEERRFSAKSDALNYAIERLRLSPASTCVTVKSKDEVVFDITSLRRTLALFRD